MSWTFGLAVYFVVWWIMLFSVLPFGVTSQHEGNDMIAGTDPGAPMRARMGRKVLINTVVSGIVWLVIDLLYIRYYLGS